jgi:hypothetical protein
VIYPIVDKPSFYTEVFVLFAKNMHIPEFLTGCEDVPAYGVFTSPDAIEPK